ncbi:MAG: AAA family ATPase [Pseudomonadota bacterium]
MERFVIITGCSGGGKSTLLDALAARGHHVVEEPGRRLMREGLADPYRDLKGFAEAAIRMSLADRQRAATLSGWVFFDRGLIDAASALSDAGGPAAPETLKGQPRCHGTVFFAPPWQEIFTQDDERKHDFASATGEAQRLRDLYLNLGYQLTDLPKVSVGERAQWVLEQLGPPPDA